MRHPHQGPYFLGECFLNTAILYLLRRQGCLRENHPIHCSDNADCLKRLKNLQGEATTTENAYQLVAIIDLEETPAQRRGLLNALERLGCSGLPAEADPSPKPLLIRCPQALVVLLPGGPEKLLEAMGVALDVDTLRRLKSRRVLREAMEGASTKTMKALGVLAKPIARLICGSRWA